MVINLSIAVHNLPMCMLTLFFVDEILLLRYVNWSTNFNSDVNVTSHRDLVIFIFVHIYALEVIEYQFLGGLCILLNPQH